MKTYSVFAKQNDLNSYEDTIFVREGFSIGAIVFKSFWMLYYKMWLSAALLFGIGVLFIILKKYAIINEGAVTAMQIGMALYIGFSAKDWLCSHLQHNGYQQIAVILGDNEFDARKRFLGNCN